MIFAPWLSVLLKFLLAAVPPSLIAWLWREVTAHSIYLYAQRTPAVVGRQARYRVAVQNNEDVPLGEHTLKVEILDEDGRFCEGPIVYAGCNRFTTDVDAENRRWRLTFAELPAYDTWSIDCVMTSAARNIKIEVDERHTRLSGRKLFLAADQNSTMTARRTATEWWWAFMATSVAVGIYLGAVAVVFGFERIERGDLLFSAAVAAFGALLYICSRIFSPRLVSPFTQGYWDPVKTALTVRSAPKIE